MMKGRMKSGYSCSMVPPDAWLAAAADTRCCTARLHSQSSAPSGEGEEVNKEK